MEEKISSVRNACLGSLVDFEKYKKYSNIELSGSVKKYGFGDRDRTFFTKLFYGVIEKKLTLDYYIDRLSEKKNRDPRVINILRMGLYQIIYMDKVPDSAACDESVKLAKKSKNRQAAPYVNAVLRNFLRKRGELERELYTLNDLEIKYSCSSDIINIWTDSYGAGTAKKILEASLLTRGLTITVNSLKISRDEFLDKLQTQNIGAKKTDVSQYGVTTDGGVPAQSIYGYDEGLFYVQDEASQICAQATGAAPGDLVIDCCAAPGGKSFFMAQMMQNSGRIVCFDIHKNKLNVVDSSAKKLGITIIETHIHDSKLRYDIKNADIVLCDVPCSGLGVISKKPEIKYKTLEEISKLPKLQYKILSACSNYVKPGGTLVYSTCTLNKRENEEVVYGFLDENKNFECADIQTFFPFERIDGFFLVKMKRIGV